jgi:hypothetical protein
LPSHRIASHRIISSSSPLHLLFIMCIDCSHPGCPNQSTYVYKKVHTCTHHKTPQHGGPVCSKQGCPKGTNKRYVDPVTGNVSYFCVSDHPPGHKIAVPTHKRAPPQQSPPIPKCGDLNCKGTPSRHCAAANCNYHTNRRDRKSVV